MFSQRHLLLNHISDFIGGYVVSQEPPAMLRGIMVVVKTHKKIIKLIEEALNASLLLQVGALVRVSALKFAPSIITDGDAPSRANL